jgi:hypothetical protein
MLLQTLVLLLLLLMLLMGGWATDPISVGDLLQVLVAVQ